MITPSELSVKVESPTSVVVSGMQKDMVGEFAAKIRSVRPPEPYKGKGIAYEGEVIKRKAGKKLENIALRSSTLHHPLGVMINWLL